MGWSYFLESKTLLLLGSVSKTALYLKWFSLLLVLFLPCFCSLVLSCLHRCRSSFNFWRMYTIRYHNYLRHKVTTILWGHNFKFEFYICGYCRVRLDWNCKVYLLVGLNGYLQLMNVYKKVLTFIHISSSFDHCLFLFLFI
jgi:hypothetical protein